MFSKILIANRGEIACRIARSCRRLGVRTVAIYSDADADALHVQSCDEAWPVGPAPARESYLNVERILEVAKASGAQAIHPGYGFLAENADFAEACAAADIVFIGPPPEAIRAMGSKSAAKAIMAEAGVPLVPGYHGDRQDPDFLAKAADEIGYPVLIKASAGGGGKGMRRVDEASGFPEALASAKREAASSFGDDHVLIEKYLLQPRHMVIQVFGDTHGNAVHLFERDCSVQRRHQKVIEEAPAPGLSAAQREEMGAAAVAAANAIGYVNAGTVEFIMDRHGDFYFMEMNTRLQVEHPITEMITGQDLVDWQLQIAAGGRLPAAQQDLHARGHAFEARIYAEDPERDFLPATGTIHRLHTPQEGPHVRIDTGVRQGDAISVHYDPMIAKLIVWDKNRPAALRRLQQALAEYAVLGTTTNARFLANVANHPAFARGAVDTGFIADYHDDLFPAPTPASSRILAAAALYELLRIEQAATEQAQASGDPWSPWGSSRGWQPSGSGHHELHLHDGAHELSLVAHYRQSGFLLELPEKTVHAQGQLQSNGRLSIVLDGTHLNALILADGAQRSIIVGEESHQLTVHDPYITDEGDKLGQGSLTAPMPGLVLNVMVNVGDTVAEGDPLMVLEAMKMEHTIRAFTAGVVEAVNYAAGDQVGEGAELLAIASAQQEA
jgi:3-methylcrotonyl-CoA carboxylase alpha subunit